MSTFKLNFSGMRVLLAAAAVSLALFGVTFTPAAAADAPATVASPAPAVEAFDGKKLYDAAFALIRDNQIKLIDPVVRDAWAAEWEHKYDTTGDLDTESGADRAVTALVESVKAMEGPTERFDMYLTPDKSKKEADQVQSSRVGVGINVIVRQVPEIIRTADSVSRVMHRQLVVSKVLEGGPAENLVHTGDVLTEIGCASLELADNTDCREVETMELPQVADAIQGKEGSDVILTFARTADDGQVTTLRFKLQRKDVIDKVVHFRDLGNGVAYIKIDIFLSKNIEAEMVEALTKAAKYDKLILDLRGNRGGFTEAAVRIAGMMMSQGKIFVTKTREGNQLTESQLVAEPDFFYTVTKRSGFALKQPVPRPELILPETTKIVILTDKDTASASEILAGALKANKRAVTLGTGTFGKGVGQAIYELPYGRILHVTSFQFFPGGLNVNGVGIDPDYPVAQDASSQDKQLEEAVKVLN